MIELTPREKQVLMLVCDDRSNLEIATKLKLGLRTIEKVKTSLFKKTRTKSILSLFKWAVKEKRYKF